MSNMQDRVKAATLINHVINPKECTTRACMAEDVGKLIEIFENMDSVDKSFTFDHLLFATMR